MTASAGASEQASRSWH